MITASEPSWIPRSPDWTHASLPNSDRAASRGRRSGPDGRPWSLPLDDRVLLHGLLAHQLWWLGGRCRDNRNDCKAWAGSSAKAAGGQTTTIADRGYPGTGLVMPHRRRKGEELPASKEEQNRSHKQVRARVEHVFARVKTWKILRGRFEGDGVHRAMLGIARLHNLIPLPGPHRHRAGRGGPAAVRMPGGPRHPIGGQEVAPVRARNSLRERASECSRPCTVEVMVLEPVA